MKLVDVPARHISTEQHGGLSTTGASANIRVMDELIRVVVSDLDYLASTWNQQSITDDDLRRGSTQLRSLLVEGNLLRAWRKFGLLNQPNIIAPRLEGRLRDHATISLAVAGGGNYEGMTTGLTLIRTRSLGPEGFSVINKNDFEHTFKTTAFLDSCAMVVDGKRVKRREVIQYVANKLGGVHYDTQRSESAFAALDTASVRINILGKNPVYFELLSIGQLLALGTGRCFVSRCGEG